jgi:hypothetical protein
MGPTQQVAPRAEVFQKGERDEKRVVVILKNDSVSECSAGNFNAGFDFQPGTALICRLRSLQRRQPLTRRCTFQHELPTHSRPGSLGATQSIHLQVAETFRCVTGFPLAYARHEVATGTTIDWSIFGGSCSHSRLRWSSTLGDGVPELLLHSNSYDIEPVAAKTQPCYPATWSTTTALSSAPPRHSPSPGLQPAHKPSCSR